MKKSLMIGLMLGLVSTSAFAAEFTCNGKVRDDSGDWQDAQISVVLDGDHVSVKEEGTAYGLDIEATYDDSYRPTAKYAGFYRYNAKEQTEAGWNDVLIIKPMADNKRAQSGTVVFQGSEEDGGIAAYFDACQRKN